MIPFQVQFTQDQPIYEQVVFAAKKAIVSGRLKPGDPFPSVRVLSQELRINPNTAQKVSAHLREEGLIEVKPGLGSVISKSTQSLKSEKTDLLDREVERLVVEAKKLQLSYEDVLAALQQHWNSLSDQSNKAPQ